MKNRLKQKPFMKKRFLVAIAISTVSLSFAQQKQKQSPPPPAPPAVMDVREVPPPPPPPKAPDVPKDYQVFLKRNPTVKALGWSKNKVHIHLKSGTEEVYRLDDKQQMQQLQNKYGKLLIAPPPPPEPPTVHGIGTES